MRYLTTSILVACLAVFSVTSLNAYADAGPADAAVAMDAAPVDADAAPVDAEPAPADANVAADADLPDPDADPQGFAEEAYAKIKAGKWSEFAALCVIFLVFAFRKWGNKALDLVGLDSAGKWLSTTDRGGVVTVLIVALGGAIAHALYVGADLDMDLAKSMLKVVAEAIGGFVGVKKFLFPGDQKA